MHWIAVFLYSVFNSGMSRALADVLKSHQTTSLLLLFLIEARSSFIDVKIPESKCFGYL